MIKDKNIYIYVLENETNEFEKTIMQGKLLKQIQKIVKKDKEIRITVTGDTKTIILAIFNSDYYKAKALHEQLNKSKGLLHSAFFSNNIISKNKKKTKYDFKLVA